MLLQLGVALGGCPQLAPDALERLSRFLVGLGSGQLDTGLGEGETSREGVRIYLAIRVAHGFQLVISTLEARKRVFQCLHLTAPLIAFHRRILGVAVGTIQLALGVICRGVMVMGV